MRFPLFEAKVDGLDTSSGGDRLGRRAPRRSWSTWLLIYSRGSLNGTGGCQYHHRGVVGGRSEWRVMASEMKERGINYEANTFFTRERRSRSGSCLNPAFDGGCNGRDALVAVDNRDGDGESNERYEMTITREYINSENTRRALRMIEFKASWYLHKSRVESFPQTRHPGCPPSACFLSHAHHAAPPMQK